MQSDFLSAHKLLRSNEINMIKYLIFNLHLCTSCNSVISEASNVDNLSDTSTGVSKVTDDSCADDSLKQNSFIWYSSFDSHKAGIIMKRGDKLGSIKSADSAMVLVGKIYKIQLEKIKTKGDTIFVKIVNTNYFTQRMGSTGSSEFILSCIYTLTDHFGFNYVNFLFEEGDHGGQPGTRDKNHHFVEKPEAICP